MAKGWRRCAEGAGEDPYLNVDVDMAGLVYTQNLAALAEKEPQVLAWIDEAVRRVLTVKERLGLFDNPYARHDAAREAAVMLSPAEHRTAARETARRSIVLLKNEGAMVRLFGPAGARGLHSDGRTGPHQPVRA